jgi:hypothetical protein
LPTKCSCTVTNQDVLKSLAEEFAGVVAVLPPKDRTADIENVTGSALEDGARI